MPATLSFITGVCGVGKSSIIPRLRELLPSDRYAIHDFDERGVPTGADRAWRLAETGLWVRTAAMNAANGKSTIVCGFANPDERDQLVAEPGLAIAYILLDADEGTIRSRLGARNSDAAVRADAERATGTSFNAFIENNVSFAPILRDICARHVCPIVQTSRRPVAEVANEIIQMLRRDT